MKMWLDLQYGDVHVRDQLKQVYFDLRDTPTRRSDVQSWELLRKEKKKVEPWIKTGFYQSND